MKTIEQFKEEVDKRVEATHLENLQINLSDDILIHAAESENYDIDFKNGIEILTRMTLSINFCGKYHRVDVEIDEDGDLDFPYVEGELCEALEDQLYSDYEPHIIYLWEKVQIENHGKIDNE